MKHVARLAIKQFGSVKKYTEAMKYNLEHFSEIMDRWQSQIPEEMKQNDLFLKLASNKEKDASSDEVQHIVREIYLKAVQDTEYGAGSCDYIVRAFQCYRDHG